MFRKLKSLGPGLLYAGAAVGVSHIVQSTKAGAEYGYVLIIGIVLAHIFKYPFFELGPKYTQTTGQNLLHGYAKIGKWALGIVALLTVATMFTIQAAVTIVTAGLAIKITHLNVTPVVMSAILLAICLGISAIGRFSVLNKLMKVIMVTLAITTIIALVSSFSYQIPASQFKPGKVFDLFNSFDVIFLIAFLGWMPAPLDIAIWHSIWSEEKIAQDKDHKPTKSLFDFNVGFWGTALLGISFLVLGANVIYGSGIELASGGVAYAQQLIDIYVSSIGSWSYWIIAIAAFTTMFSTTLTCLDAMPRVLTKIRSIWKENNQFEDINSSPKEIKGSDKEDAKMRLIWLFVVAIGALILLKYFITDMKQMVNVATSFSFLTAPVLAILGIIIVKRQLPVNFWSKWKFSIAYLGVGFLVILGAVYIRLVIL
ncbi:MAG: Mn2+/Fe2+ NRAMP family transporter [bacterium]